MQLKVYRSLDRPSAFFGIRGRYQSIALYAYLVDLVVSFFIAQASNGLIGVLAFIAIGALIYLGTIYLQGMHSDRALFRMLSARRLPSYVKVPPCRVSSLLIKTR